MIRLAAAAGLRGRRKLRLARRRRLQRRGFHLESLESRVLMAADLAGPSTEDVPLSSVAEWMSGTGATSPAPVSSTAAEDVAEGENAPDLVAFAKALTAAGVKMFAADWCPFCTQQKQLFQDGARFLPFIEVTNPDRTLNSVGVANNITTFPTWEFQDGSRLTGLQTLETLSQRSQVPIPTSSLPSIAPIADLTLQQGSPRYIPIDAYDPNGGPLTITVSSSNPNVVSAQVPQGNRSLKMSVSNFGDMVFQLFEDKAPLPSSRVIQLAQNGFFNAANSTTGMIFHRVISNFVIQTGDPTGTGGGGSTLGDFDDQFHVDLQHNQPGVLSYAKSGDDTNDSQIFITASPQRLLDFNHSVFGQLIEGDGVRAAIARTAVNASDKPTRDVKIDTVSVFNDSENGLVFLKANGATGESDVTVTVTDQQGNTFTETFRVTVAADTSNSAPFLSPISPVQTTANTPVTIQLQATDVENDPKYFDAVVAGGTNFTFNVNHDTGAVTVNPPANFVGTLELLVGVRGATAADTVDQFDTERVTIAVVPQAPSGVDLLAESDTGASNTDNITNRSTARIQVSGVTSGAQVTLRAGSTVIGTATAQGSTVTIEANLSTLADGTHTITAVQRVNNQTSSASAGLQLKLDRQPPTFLSTAPAAGQVGQRLLYNAATAEEAANEATYSLVNAPAGAVIDVTTGVLDWTPTAAQRGQHSFSIQATDLAGNSRRQDLQVSVDTQHLVQYRLQTRRTNGTSADSFQVGEEFLLDVFVSDIRVTPRGVVSAFVDLVFPASVTPVGNLQFGTRFDQNRSGTVIAGSIDEAGGVSPSTQTGGQEHLLFTAQFRVEQPGEIVFQTNPADTVPQHHTLLVDQTGAVPQDKILYGTANVAVALPFTVANDLFNVDEDATINLDVKANDTFKAAPVGTLRVSALGTPSHGGQVALTTDGKVRYQPAANFNGTETFTYSLTNDVSGSAQGTVTVQVQPLNDPPTAVNDSFTGTTGVQEDSSQKVLNVLANDSIAPDTGETLRVTAVTAISNGGTVTIAPNGTHVIYTPATNFFGTETFRYTVSDGRGGTATATASVEVKNVNDPPRVQSDVFSISEDAAATQFDPLANDSSGVDPTETLTITQVVRAGSGTGTATITADGKKVIYTPAANFFGEESFNYTVSDGNGGTTTGSIRFTVTPQNDPPTAVNDTQAAKFSVSKNTTANRLEVLRNDVITPDAGEMLTVTSATVPTQGGTVQVASDGKAVLYTPPANFLGTDTFSYTISDGNGGTATASVEVEVRNFLPSTLGGFVYVDANNNGTFDTGEQALGNIKVTLQGTDQFGAAVNVTQSTLTNGSYQFTNVAPGNYTVRQTQPEFFMDGRDTAGSRGGTVTNDAIAVVLPENVNATSYNFGELGRHTAFVGIRDLFRSTTARPSMFLIVDTTANQTTYAANGTWSEVNSPAVTLSSDQRTWNISVRNGQQVQLIGSFPNRNTSALQVLGTRSGKTLLRIVGRLADLPFQTSTTGSGASGEGEGESAIATIAQARVAAQASSRSAASNSAAAHVDAALANWNEPAAAIAAADFGELFASAHRRRR